MEPIAGTSRPYGRHAGVPTPVFQEGCRLLPQRVGSHLSCSWTVSSQPAAHSQPVDALGQFRGSVTAYHTPWVAPWNPTYNVMLRLLRERAVIGWGVSPPWIILAIFTISGGHLRVTSPSIQIRSWRASFAKGGNHVPVMRTWIRGVK
jgi:hypothetical protein